MTIVLLAIITIVAINAIVVAVFFYMKSRKVNDPVENPEPTTEPEPVEKSMFKKDDWITDGKETMLITEVTQGKYIEITPDGDMTEDAIAFVDKHFHLWTIEDAKDGDVLATEDWVFIFEKLNSNGKPVCYCHYDIELGFRIDANSYIATGSEIYPATKDQRDLLFTKMTEAGYTWDAETKTLSKIEEPDPEPDPVGTEEPNEDEFDVNKAFKDFIDYFKPVVEIKEGSKTYNYLKERFDEAEAQFLESVLFLTENDLYRKELFPTVYDYYNGEFTEDVNPFEHLEAWLLGLVLAELTPDKRQQLIQMAYDYPSKGSEMPTYGYSWDSDPNNLRMIASAIYASTRDASVIPELRKEVGGKMLTYKNDISECYIDCTKFMPTAPSPFIKGYKKRPKGTPVGASDTACMDGYIHGYITQYYSLDTKDAEKRQRTIQAIADKEYKKPHLFGKPRTVIDSKYGEMTFNPVFGKHNIGIEIPDDGVIADMCYKLGKPCSHTRETLLNQEYGRRRPGEGETDGKANSDPKQRVLVNYAIEEGDGRTTGYYNKNGVYVDNNGTSIGDYEAYFQNQVYANSYPSGHSAYIMGVGLILMMIMPERADKILKAVNEYANSRMICRFHWQSDTIHGRVIGTMMVPVLAATTNVDFDNLLKKAKEEYQRILSGDVTPEPTPEPTEKVNTSLAYAIGGYGSCHVDAGEKEMIHCCTKQCTKERHPAITVNQRVNFTIEGAGVTTDDGKTSGVWEVNKPYGIKCPAVKEDQIATITMRNENGVKVLEYRCSKNGTHDDGPKEI